MIGCFSLEPGYSYFKPSKSGKGVNLGYTISVEEIFKVRLQKERCWTWDINCQDLH